MKGRLPVYKLKLKLKSFQVFFVSVIELRDLVDDNFLKIWEYVHKSFEKVNLEYYTNNVHIMYINADRHLQ